MSTLHVHDVTRDRLIDELTAEMIRQGFDRLAELPRAEPVVRRVVVRGQGQWVSVAESDVLTATPLARTLSRRLDRAAVTFLQWEDEHVFLIETFERGVAKGMITNKSLRRGGYLKVLPLLRFVHEVEREAVRDKGLFLGDLVVPDELAMYAEELKALGLDSVGEGTTFEIHEIFEAVGRSIGIGTQLLNPYDPDPSTGDIELAFVPRARQPR